MDRWSVCGTFQTFQDCLRMLSGRCVCCTTGTYQFINNLLVAQDISRSGAILLTSGKLLQDDRQPGILLFRPFKIRVLHRSGPVVGSDSRWGDEPSDATRRHHRRSNRQLVDRNVSTTLLSRVALLLDDVVRLIFSTFGCSPNPKVITGTGTGMTLESSLSLLHLLACVTLEIAEGQDLHARLVEDEDNVRYLGGH